MTKKFLLLLLSFVAIGGASQQAYGTFYWENSSQITPGASDATVAEAKFRLSYTNWDQSLSDSAGTTTTSNGNTFLSNNLVGYGTSHSDLTSLNQFSFVFQHLANEGFVFTMTDLSNPANVYTLAWGSGFSSLPGSAQIAATLPTATNSGIAPTGSFNSLTINAQDSRNKPSSLMSFSNLAFSGTDSAGNVFTLADGSLQTSGSELATSFLSQRIVANTDLSTSNWSISGNLAGTRDNSTGGDDSVKFYIDAVQNNYSISGATANAPEPGSIAALVGLVAISFGGPVTSRLRKKKTA